MPEKNISESGNFSLKYTEVENRFSASYKSFFMNTFQQRGVNEICMIRYKIQCHEITKYFILLSLLE